MAETNIKYVDSAGNYVEEGSEKAAYQVNDDDPKKDDFLKQLRGEVVSTGPITSGPALAEKPSVEKPSGEKPEGDKPTDTSPPKRSTRQ